MSIVTFWNNGKEQTGKTLSMAAISTYMAINHNYKILFVATGYQDKTINNCFWEEKVIKKNLGMFGPNTNVGMDEGLVGLTKVMNSNKLSPDQITNYSKIIFKDRLEVLPAFKGDRTEYERLKQYYPDIINLANQYYDLIFVDLDNELGEKLKEEILQDSNLIVASLTQKLSSINEFMEMREKVSYFNSKKTLLMIGKHDRFSKYTIKNISRYMGEKNKVSTIPYNTLFFEAAEEAKVPDLFLRLRNNTDEEDRNGFFIAEIRRTAENIIYRLQDLAMKM